MKLITFLLSFCYFLPGFREKTDNMSGKTFITQNLDYVQFVNDTTLFCSLPKVFGGPEHYYKIQNDSLCILNAYSVSEGRFGDTEKIKITYVQEWYNFKIIGQRNDSLLLLNKYLASDSSIKLDTLKLINADKLKEPIINFKSFYYRTTGNYQIGPRVIHIDSLGKINIDNQRFSRKALITTGEFTKNEFQNFLNILSNAQLSKLPTEMGDCGMHPSPSYYKIEFDNKIITSYSCEFSSFHYQFLYKYLDQLEENTGIIKRLK